MADAGTSQAAKPARARKPPKRKQVEQVVRGYFDALSRRDPDAAVQFWREDGVDELVPLRVLRGRREVAGFFHGLNSAVPDLELTVKRVVAGESQAGVEWRAAGTFSGGPFEGVEPNGKPVELRGFDLFEVEDGQIVGNTAYWDGMAFARQVGLFPPQDSGTERAMKNAFNALTKVRKVVNERVGTQA